MTLNWKQSDDWRVREARGARAIGGTYRIHNYGEDGFFVDYRKARKPGWWSIGTVATEGEAIALAQANHDKKLVALIHGVARTRGRRFVS
jgi:hypothetical protein